MSRVKFSKNVNDHTSKTNFCKVKIFEWGNIVLELHFPGRQMLAELRVSCVKMRNKNVSSCFECFQILGTASISAPFTNTINFTSHNMIMTSSLEKCIETNIDMT